MPDTVDSGKELCDAYLDGDLAVELEGAFRAWLNARPEHMHEFVQAAHLHRALRDELKGRSVRRAERNSEKTASGGARSWKAWGMAAAFLLLAGYCVYRFMASDPMLALYTARIEKVSGPVFAVDRAGALRSAAQEAKYLTAQAGLEFDGPGQAVLKYSDGTTLNFLVKSSRSTLSLTRPEDKTINPARVGKRVTVENGELLVDAASQPNGAPFILSTPQAEVTVVGTVFRLEVNALQTRLEVTHGSVRIARYSDSASVDVTDAEYVVVSRTGALLVKRAEAPAAH